MAPEVERHVSEYIERTNWPLIQAEISDPCEGCPGKAWAETHPDERDRPPCFECPLWSLKVDLVTLAIRRRLARGREDHQ